ncbi:MAG: hypothetical protein ACPGWM_06490 [Flavobacteriales bacterium]
MTKVSEMKGHSGPIYSLEQGKSPKSLFTCSGDSFVAEWDIEKMEPTPFSIKLETPAYSLLHDTSFKRLLIGNSVGEIHVIDLVQKTESRFLQAHHKGVFAFAMVAQEGWIISAGGNGNLAVWDRESLNFVRHVSLPPAKIRSLLYLEEKNELWVAQGNGMIHVLDLPYFNTKASFMAHEEGANSLVYYREKDVVISGGKDAHLRVWKAENKDEVLSMPAHNFGIYSLYIKGNTMISVSRDKAIKLWDLNDFSHIETIKRPKEESHTHSINALYYSTEMDVFITAGDDRRIIKWKLSE